LIFVFTKFGGLFGRPKCDCKKIPVPLARYQSSPLLCSSGGEAESRKLADQ